MDTIDYGTPRYDEFRAFLARIELPKLNRQRERELVEAVQERLQKGLSHGRPMELLIRHNTGLIMRMAHNAYRSYGRKCGLGLDDLYGVGAMALTYSVEKFDLDRKYRLFTYAKFIIKGRMSREAEEIGHEVALPVKPQQWRRRMQRKKRTEYARTGAYPQPEALLECLKCVDNPEPDVELVKKLETLKQLPFSLDRMITHELFEGGEEVHERIPDTRVIGVDVALERESLWRDIGTAMGESLSPRELLVLMHVYGKERGRDLDYDQLIDELRQLDSANDEAAGPVTKNRVGQLKRRAEKKLRAFLRASRPEYGIANENGNEEEAA